MKKAIAATKGLYKRGNTYYVRKMIPANLRKIAGKREFLVSLKTDNYEIAIQKYSDVKNKIEYAISTMIDGTYQNTEHDFSHYFKIAAANGRTLDCFAHAVTNPEKLSSLALQLRKAEESGKLSKHNVLSFINIKEASIKLSELPAVYIEAKKLELKTRNSREYNRAIDPLKNACKQLIKFFNEDKTLKNITKSDARSFHKHLTQKIYDDAIAPNTANKYLTHIRVLIDTYHDHNGLENENVFSGFRFAESSGQRSPLTSQFIASRWLGNPVFENTAPVLKYMLWAMIDTGCNFKELCGLDPETDIHLDDDIPYIDIRANETRRLKTSFRSRKIPLVGLALEAFKKFPLGFQKYNTVNGPTNASAALNKFLKNNNLFENNKQSAYSARHCFKDRLRHHNMPAEMQDYLMGHKSPGMGSHYGNGYSLEQTQTALRLIENDFK